MAGIFNRGGNDSKAEMSFIDHLEELRKHIIRSVDSGISWSCCYFYLSQLGVR